MTRNGVKVWKFLVVSLEPRARNKSFAGGSSRVFDGVQLGEETAEKGTPVRERDEEEKTGEELMTCALRGCARSPRRRKAPRAAVGRPGSERRERENTPRRVQIHEKKLGKKSKPKIDFVMLGFEIQNWGF